MDRDRLYLQNLLENILGSDNVYFQEPPSYGMKYPAIIYNFVKKSHTYANNKKYMNEDHWEVILINTKQDSDMIDKLEKLDYTYMINNYKKDNLYHTVYNISLRR